MHEAKLLPLVNRVYEVALQVEELKAFGVNEVVFSSNLGLRFPKVELDNALRKASFLDSIDGKRTHLSRIVEVFGNILRKWKDNWSSHFWYPYKAKMRPPVARALVNIVLRGNDGLVLDPFCGSGTTLVEARWLGADSIGVDAVPFYVELTRAKCSVFEGEMNEAIELLLEAYKRTTDEQRAELRRDEILLTMEWTKDLLEQLEIKPGKFEVAEGDARSLSSIPADSVDGIVTSPPYAEAIDYLNMDAHGLLAMGFSKRKLRSLKRRMIYADKRYAKNMALAYYEMDRVLKPGGRVAVVIGNSRGKDNIRFTKRFFAKRGYRLLMDVEELIASTGVYSIQFDHILLFEKPD